MLAIVMAVTESTPLVPEEGSAKLVWAVVAAVILGLYLLMKSARTKAAQEYWDRRRREEERIANDPDMRKE